MAMSAARKDMGMAASYVRKEVRDEEPELFVWLTVALAVILGWLLLGAVTNQTTTASAANNQSLTYPATWQTITEKGTDFAAADLNQGGTFGPRVALRTLDKTDLIPKQGGLEEAAANWALERQNDLLGYRTLSITTTTVSGKAAINVENAYLLDSPFGSGGLPALMHGSDTLVLSGDKFYILSFAAESSRYDSLKPLRDKLVADWKTP